MHIVALPMMMPCALCFKQVKVLDPALISDDRKHAQKQTVAGTNVLWKDLDGRILRFEPSLLPSALCFATHMRRAVAAAESRGWIPKVCELVMLLAW
jgi:hypothetical protein